MVVVQGNKWNFCHMIRLMHIAYGQLARMQCVEKVLCFIH